MIMTDDGIIIRISLNQVSSLSRNSQGVRVIKTAKGSNVSTVAIVDPDSEETEAGGSEAVPAEEPADTAAEETQETAAEE